MPIDISGFDKASKNIDLSSFDKKESKEQSPEQIMAEFDEESRELYGATPEESLESAVRGFEHGVALGHSDRLRAAVKAPFTEKTYSEELAAERKKLEEKKSKNPTAFVSAELLGAVNNPIGKAATQLMQGAKGIIRSASVAGAEGLAQALSQVKDIDEATATELVKEVGPMTAASMLFGAAPELFSATVRKLTKAVGETDRDIADKSLQSLLNSSDSQAVALEKHAPDAIEAIERYEIVPSIATTRRGMHNNVKRAKKEIGEELERIVRSADEQAESLIQKDEILDKLRQAVDVADPAIDNRVVSGIKSTASRIEKDANYTSDTLFEAWGKQKKWSNNAFRNGAGKINPAALSAAEEGAMAARDAYKTSVDDLMSKVLPEEELLKFKQLNKDYSNLSKVDEVLSSTKRGKGFFSSMADKFTLGALFYATRNPAAAVGLIGAKESLRFAKPRLSVMPGRKPILGPTRVAAQQLIAEEGRE